MNKVTDKNGTVRWFDSDGEMHNDDGPALITATGTQEWWLHGRRHRVDGPAVVIKVSNISDPLYLWYVDGKIAKSWREFQQLSGASDEDVITLTLKYQPNFEIL